MTISEQQPPIIIRNLCKSFRFKRGRKTIALDNISFTVGRGEVFGFLGPNGAGKSTTIKTLMGMIRPGNGEAFLCGLPVGSEGSRRSVGYLPENPAFYDFLSGREYMRFVATAFSMPEKNAVDAIEHWLSRLGLAEAATRPIRKYSKGMVQRLGLAQALFHDPKVVILDEPMSGLDPQGRALVKDLIVELKEAGKTVFFSTHITADVEKVCDQLAIIVDGRLRVHARVDDILREGVTGYRVLAHGDKLSSLSGGRCISESRSEVEFHVEIANLPEQVAAISKLDGAIEVIEPMRHDLEEYFLEVVKNARS